MKLTIERAVLLKALGHVQNVVERRTSIRILSNVLMRAEGDRLSLTATDMEIEIVESVPADVQVPGATTAPAHTLYEIVRKLPDGSQVELDGTGDAGALTLKAGRSTFRLGCEPVEDFPSMAGGDLPISFSLEPGDLKALIDRTRFAVSTEETRYYLNGIYLHASAGESGPRLRAVATDGHRLARAEVPLPEGALGMPGIIIHRKTVGELHRLADEAATPIDISLSDSKIRLSLDDIVVTAKLIDGTFPDYERVIPGANDRVLEVNAKIFAEAVDRVSTIATEKSRAVKLSLGDNVLTLSATGSENGSASDVIEVKYGAPAMEIGFNARYLLEIIQQVKSGDARFLMADAASPTVIRDEEAEGGSGVVDALYVLMPMRV